MKLPTLYKKTSSGAIQQWTIGVDLTDGKTGGATIYTLYGQVDGKIQEARDTVSKGKNVGKANETTPFKQAEAEAKSQWDKKLKKGYVQSVGDAKKGKVDDVIEGGVFPMLAQTFEDRSHKIVYPAYVQPKFDGHRCIAVVKNGEATLWTRTRKPITGLPHIIKALEDAKLPDTIFDGELYNHDYKDRFEELTSFIRTPDAKEGHEVVQYHIYDIVNNERFKDRTKTLSNLYRDHKLRNPLIRVTTLSVGDAAGMRCAMDVWLEEGYEGLMMRNADGLYEINKRSNDLQKVKEFIDAEFKITGVKEGRGKMAGHAIFICKTDDGMEFDVKLKGPIDELEKYWNTPALAIGRELTVKYQGITKKNKVPRFPVGMRLATKL